MRCNESGLSIIREFEGLRLKAYHCPAGVLTIGYGHTRGVKQGDTVTEEIAERLLLQDVATVEAAIPRLITVPLNTNQFSAICAFLFNIGSDRLRGTRSQSVLNRGHYLEFADRLLIWNKANGKELSGLTRRRKAERELFLKPVLAGGKDFA
jgi:lysozyme